MKGYAIFLLFCIICPLPAKGSCRKRGFDVDLVHALAENLPKGTKFGAFVPSTPGTYTYSFISGDGATDNAKFTISGSNLKTNSFFNYESLLAQPTIRISVVESGCEILQKSFTVEGLFSNSAVLTDCSGERL